MKSLNCGIFAKIRIQEKEKIIEIMQQSNAENAHILSITSSMAATICFKATLQPK